MYEQGGKAVIDGVRGNVCGKESAPYVGGGEDSIPKLGPHNYSMSNSQIVK